MKIVVPLSNCHHYESLVEAGADEFYSGFFPYDWLKDCGTAIPLNRREYFANCNICSYSTMKVLARKAEKYKIPIKLTFNAVTYSPQRYPHIRSIIEKLMDIGYKTFIISDIGLIVYLREKGVPCDIHISGEAVIRNHMAMQLLNQFDISRIVFPRKTSLKTIKDSIRANSTVKNCTYETFILNSNCIYTGGLCNTVHCEEMGIFCFVPSEVRKTKDNPIFQDEIKYVGMCYKHANRNNKKHANTRIKQRSEDIKKDEKVKEQVNTPVKRGCGLCYIKELTEIGITHGKIVGRESGFSAMIKDVKDVREAINMISNNSDTESYKKAVKEQFFSNKCPEAFCYYPS